MTKTKKNTQSITILDLIKSPYRYSTFTNPNIKKLHLSIYSLVLIILIIIVSLLTNNIGNYPLIKNSTLILTNFLVIIGITLFSYGIFYIFLNALENNRKPFMESLLIATTIIYPFIFIGNLLNYIGQYIANIPLIVLFLNIIFLILIYSIITFILTFRKYYQTSKYKIITSMLLSMMLIGIIFITEYLNYLLNVLK